MGRGVVVLIGTAPRAQLPRGPGENAVGSDFPPRQDREDSGLKRSERRNIAVFRIQCASYVATHAGAYDTDLYGPKQRYFRRYCVWKECCDAAALDDARHVLLHCPLHDIDRAVMLRSVRTALHNVRLTLEDIGSETAVVQLLLGSVPVTAAHALSAHQTTHRDILRASSKYLKYVYDTRWKYGHNFKQ